MNKIHNSSNIQILFLFKCKRLKRYNNVCVADNIFIDLHLLLGIKHTTSVQQTNGEVEDGGFYMDHGSVRKQAKYQQHEQLSKQINTPLQYFMTNC